MKIKDVIQALDAWAPRRYQESYDNSGLLVGNQEAEVKGVMVCLDVTEAIIDEAKSKGCNLIVGHHPIIFKGLKSLTGKHYTERIAIKAIQEDIALFAIHTNLDNQITGVNSKIGEVLGLENLEILRPRTGDLLKLVCFVPKKDAESVMKAMFESGAGTIGDYDECSFRLEGKGTFKAGAETNPHVGEKGSRHEEAEERVEVVVPAHAQNQVIAAMTKAHPYEEVAYDLYRIENAWNQLGAGMVGDLKSEMTEAAFLYMLKTSFEVEVVRHTKFLRKNVKRIAFCGGSGFFLLQDAIRAKADVYITADVKYHEFMEADGNLVLADIGHYESEQFTSDLIRDYLVGKFHTFAVLLAGEQTNPINYF